MQRGVLTPFLAPVFQTKTFPGLSPHQFSSTDEILERHCMKLVLYSLAAAILTLAGMSAVVPAADGFEDAGSGIEQHID